MRFGGFLVFACALAVLTGCADPSPSAGSSPLIPTDVSADTVPAFLDEPQDPVDAIPPEVADTFNVDPAYARYQGVWYGEDVYLSVASGTVMMIGVNREDPSLMHAGHSNGNVPFAWESGDTTDEKWILQYLPQGTADLPDGWTAFSSYLGAFEGEGSS